MRIKLIADDSAATLVGFVREIAEPGATIITDGYPSYRPLSRFGFTHRRLVQGDPADGTTPIPNVHQAIANLKTWLVGTHKGVGRQHLAAYLDEFVFRYNRRHNLAAAFQTLLGIGAGRAPTTYATISGAKDLPVIAYTPSRRETGRRRPRLEPPTTTSGGVLS